MRSPSREPTSRVMYSGTVARRDRTSGRPEPTARIATQTARKIPAFFRSPEDGPRPPEEGNEEQWSRCHQSQVGRATLKCSEVDQLETKEDSEARFAFGLILSSSGSYRPRRAR